MKEENHCRTLTTKRKKKKTRDIQHGSGHPIKKEAILIIVSLTFFSITSSQQYFHSKKMNKLKSKAVIDKSDERAKTKQAFTHSKGPNDCCQTNARMMQNILLIWLDNNIDENNTDCRNTITQLRCSVNTINTFTNTDRCIDFLTDIYDENVCMIISGALCQHLVPLIHPVIQLQTIFIFCRNKTQLEQWAKN